MFFTHFTVTYVRQLVDYLTSLGYGSLATLMGRYYAMDRDKRYERTKIAYEGLTKGVGEEVPVDQLIQVCVCVCVCVCVWLPIYLISILMCRKWRSATILKVASVRLMSL